MSEEMSERENILFFVKVFCVESWLPKAPQSLPEAPPGNQKPVNHFFFVGEQCGSPNHEDAKPQAGKYLGFTYFCLFFSKEMNDPLWSRGVFLAHWFQL